MATEITKETRLALRRELTKEEMSGLKSDNEFRILEWVEFTSWGEFQWTCAN